MKVAGDRIPFNNPEVIEFSAETNEYANSELARTVMNTGESLHSIRTMRELYRGFEQRWNR